MLIYSIEANRISTKGANALAIALETNSSLKQLNIGMKKVINYTTAANCIDDQAGAAIGPALRLNHGLVVLVLGKHIA